jgi:hypothetical protein
VWGVLVPTCNKLGLLIAGITPNFPLLSNGRMASSLLTLPQLQNS